MIYIGLRIGLTYIEIGRLPIGLWMDLYESFKSQYNFETKKGIYDLSHQQGVSTLDAI